MPYIGRRHFREFRFPGTPDTADYLDLRALVEWPDSIQIFFLMYVATAKAP